MKSLEPISKYMEELAVDVLKNQKKNKVLTGFNDLDLLLDGFQESELILLAARPAMGKSTLALNIAFNIAQQFATENKQQDSVEKVVAYFSFGLRNKDIAKRILSNKCSIPLNQFRHKFNQESTDDLLAGCTLFQQLPFFVNDMVRDIDELKSNLHSIQSKNKKVGLIVIDSLHLLEDEMKAGGCNMIIHGIICALKRIAREFDIPMLLTVNLDRKIEERDSKRPMLSDLWYLENGETVADKVLFLYRDIYYLQNEVLKRKKNESPESFTLRVAELEQKKLELYNKAEIIVAMNKHGPIGSVKLLFNGDFMRFSNWSEENN